MSWDNKVVWSEGMFIRPQHFQQQDRWIEKLVRGRVADLGPCPWGLVELAVDQDLLGTGRFAAARVRGVFEDGTLFSVPDDTDHPAPLAVPPDTRNRLVYLGVPLRRPGAADVDHADAPEAATRFAAREIEVADANAFSTAEARIGIGRLRLRYLLEGEDRAGYATIALARIVEVRPDRQIVLDTRFVPPVLTVTASPVLTGHATEIAGMLHQRGEALADRVAHAGAGGVAEIADYMLLQTVNRHEPVFAHLLALGRLHPERLYTDMLALMGDLAVFTAGAKRPASLPPYEHEDLGRTFRAVMTELRQALSAVLEQTAIPVPLELRNYGIRVARIDDRSLLDQAAFVLAVKADAPAEAVRRHLPQQMKIGPVEQIRNLVNAALPGIAIRPLAVAPRQLPFHPGVQYFELERTSRFWDDLKTSGGMAVHVAGEFPGLVLECWAIKAPQV
ncbi:type VI secretion system baseplate subunit TssK (plasmid) [Tistrella mobilis]|uniref:Type VI secretion protein n=1 Tax=Tistrella mobilis TaxID=171437 RepID=A0A161R5S8_9PROT|nr:type VI secretion system baseplate subunit TssK [Tistrella mobilis]KYO54615.1 type VI secretion protein [Tistrella mobilis]